MEMLHLMVRQYIRYLLNNFEKNRKEIFNSQGLKIFEKLLIDEDEEVQRKARRVLAIFGYNGKKLIVNLNLFKVNPVVELGFCH